MVELRPLGFLGFFMKEKKFFPFGFLGYQALNR